MKKYPGNPDKHIGPAIVAFIDILGISDSMLKDWGAEINSALHRYLRIKNSPPTVDPRSQVHFKICDPENDQVLDQCYSITRTLSDSIIVMLALPPSPNEIDTQGFTIRLFNVIKQVGFIWQTAIQEGFTIRGVVEIDEMFWNEVDFTGPALIKSYLIEKKLAKSSRILIAPHLLNTIINCARNDMYFERELNAFAISKKDDLLIVNPNFLIKKETRESLIQMRKDAIRDKDKAKYDELIALLEIRDDATKTLCSMDLIPCLKKMLFKCRSLKLQYSLLSPFFF